jgi:hypothetical protein
LGLGDAVLDGFLRVVTNHKVFKEPTPLNVALTYVQQLQSAPSAIRAVPSERVWKIFAELAKKDAGRVNTIPDMFMAATAIDLNATMTTADRGFARFENPLPYVSSGCRGPVPPFLASLDSVRMMLVVSTFVAGMTHRAGANDL